MATRTGIALIVAALIALDAGPARPAEATMPTVVELFTSQGCSSCPPADAYLGELAKRPDVLALGFHVDYWDYIGWKDPYAMHLATERQRKYDHQFVLPYVYTPQMVVNGVLQGVGANRGEMEALIKRATAEPASRPALAIERDGGGGLVVHIGAGRTAKPATVWLICYDRQSTTAVTRGENGGRTLANYQVVRRFDSLGTWTGDALDLPVGASLIEGYGAAPDRGVAVLVQSEGIGRILAAEALTPSK